MAQVTVSVDDATCGRFPPVCAGTGTRSDGTLTIDATVTSARLAARRRLLLLLAGPPGWALLAVLAVVRPAPGRRPAPPRVRVPWTEAAEVRARDRRVERTLLWLGCLVSAAALAVAVSAPIGDDPGLALDRPAARIVVATLVTLVVGTAAAAIVTELRIVRGEIVAALDESGRWVTLCDVHPAFRDAVREDQRRRRLPRPDPARAARPPSGS